MLEKVLGNGCFTYFEYTYDPAGRITECRRESGEWKDSGGSTVYAFEWDYDNVGNRTWQKRGSDETYYAYDAGNELLRSHELPADIAVRSLFLVLHWAFDIRA